MAFARRKQAETKEKAIIKAQKERKKQESTKIKAIGSLYRKKRAKPRPNDRSHQMKLTQDAFNRMRVLQELKWFADRGLEPVCTSCGKELGDDQWCNGHYRSRGASPELALNPKNSYLQHNVRCNKNLSGDIEGTKTTRGYRKGLLERFGEVEGQAIIDYCESPHKAKKYTCGDLVEMRKGFYAEIKMLQSALN